MRKLIKTILVLCLVSLAAAATACASDLDDGISKPYDESIERDDELGQRDRNVSFIKKNSMSKADVAAKAGTRGVQSGQGRQTGQTGQAGNSTGNLNSVVLGVGGTVRGDIIIIDQSRGDKNQVIGR